MKFDSFKLNSLYSKVKTNLKEKPYKIIRGTKTLALSSPKYNSFYKSCEDLLQIKTFKLPDEAEYPKLKSNNLISLQKKINIFSFNSKKSFEKRPLSRPKSAMTNIKSILYEKYKKKKRINFFIAENISKGKSTLSSQKYSNNSKSQNNIFDYDYQSLYQLYSIKNTERRVKDFFMLLNSIFYDEDYFYNELKYNEKEIFGHKEENLAYIKDELNYFLKREKEFDIKSDLLQLFMTKKYGKIELFLKSARIEIIGENKINDDNIMSINIPFNLMCLIYLCNGEQINYITTILLNQFEAQTLKETADNIIIFSEEQKKEIFSEILSMVELDNNNVKINMNQKNYEKYYSQLKYIEHLKEVTENVKYNNFVSGFFKDHNKIKIIDNTNNNIYNTPNYKINTKINFVTNINKYTLPLISFIKKYKVQFYMPEIVLTFNNYNKQINHYIDKELFLYLYQNNFMYWDYFVLHYLFSYKAFRKFMNGILSIKNNNNVMRKNYFLFNTKTIEEKNYNKINYLKYDSKQSEVILNPMKIYKYYLNDLYFYEMSYTENCYEFNFLFSNNINLKKYKLKSYTLYAFFNNINKPFLYEFNFNFQQMKVLYYISYFEDLAIFLKRLLYIKEDIINLDYTYFDSFSNLSNIEIFKYFNDLNNINKEKKLKDIITIQNQNNNLILRVIEPLIEVDELNLFSDIKIIQSYIKLKHQFLEDIINNNINEWIKIIYKHKSDLEDKNQEKYDDTINKQIKRQKTIGNKNKDIHKSFNKSFKISYK